MTMMYEYVVLRLSPDAMRGENINIGLAVFPQDGSPTVRISASVNKVRAIDPTWNAERQTRLKETLQQLLSGDSSAHEKIEILAALGYCMPGEPGFFYATQSSLDEELRYLAEQYISTYGDNKKNPRRSNLHREMTQQFKKMEILGSSVDDLMKHRIVPHVPIPNFPDLKGDFVYKNGVYRITQTLDYRVSAAAAHQKVSEACTKAMAARQGVKEWGSDTLKFALVCVPPEITDIADSHLDLLLASEFEIYHTDNEKDLARYYNEAFSH